MEHASLDDLPHLPFYVNPPGEFDTMMLNVGIFLVVLVLLVGVGYLSLHSLPERMSHGRIQMELVAILALIGLLTHNTAFWIAALLLAVVRVPDLGVILESMANSLKLIAGQREGSVSAEGAPDDVPPAGMGEVVEAAEPVEEAPARDTDKGDH